jgi:hypothetical protein
MVNCPKCDADVSDSYEPDDWSCGIVGGWYCDACDLGIGENEIDREPMDGDVFPSAPPRDPTAPIGTPLSQLSGRPGHPGYDEFCRIAKSYGFD